MSHVWLRSGRLRVPLRWTEVIYQDVYVCAKSDRTRERISGVEDAPRCPQQNHPRVCGRQT